MRRVVESGVVLGALAALASLPVVANALSEPQPPEPSSAVEGARYLPDHRPLSQASLQP